MSICIVLTVAAIGLSTYFDVQEKADIPFAYLLLYSFLFIGFCYFIGCIYHNILKEWDKDGYEMMKVDVLARTIQFDDNKPLHFAEIESIRFEKCDDKLLGIPKSYDMVNAQVVFQRLNGQQEIFYVQKLSWIYDMIHFFKSLNLRVVSNEFENSIFYKIQAHLWIFLLILVLSVWGYCFVQSEMF